MAGDVRLAHCASTRIACAGHTSAAAATAARSSSPGSRTTRDPLRVTSNTAGAKIEQAAQRTHVATSTDTRATDPDNHRAEAATRARNGKLGPLDDLGADVMRFISHSYFAVVAAI